MNLTAEEFVNDYLVDRNLIGRTRAAKVTSLLDAWIRQEFTGPHSRQVENLRRRNVDLRSENADLRAALDKVVAQFEGIADDKWPTEGMKVAIQQARAALGEAGE